MSEKIVQLNEEVVKSQLKELVRDSVSIPREIAHLDRSNWAVIPAGLSTLTAVVEHCGKM